MGSVVLNLEVFINPTESFEKIKQSITNVFGKLSIEIKPHLKGNVLVAKSEGLDALSFFRNALSREHIRDASRRLMLSCKKRSEITFYLNKQVAFSGHVSFSEPEAESPLGPIKVNITCDNPKEFIDWLAPRTTKNR